MAMVGMMSLLDVDAASCAGWGRYGNARSAGVPCLAPSLQSRRPCSTSCLRQVYLQNNQEAVSWLNLQCYAGGASNNPLVWGAKLAAYQLTTPAGIAQPVSFVLPGYWGVNPGSNSTCVKGKTSGQCPSTLQQTFQGFAGKGITGGFIWNSFDIFRCMRAESALRWPRRTTRARSSRG
jgi:hypothetical protein